MGRERRKHRRLEMKATAYITCLDDMNFKDEKKVEVEILDLSKSGIGFISQTELELGSYYTAKLQIWTKERVDSIIEIVRVIKTPEGYRYGGLFRDMTDSDGYKIEHYIDLQVAAGGVAV